MDSRDRPTLGALLRQHRRSAGLTQEELAERAGLSVRGLSDLERGARRLAYRDTVQRLAEALSLNRRDLAALLAASGRDKGVARSGPASELDSLPIQLTSFVGRAGELAELRSLLESNRLLTLTGAGGTGKTRLAVELGRASQAAFVDGVAFVDLSPVADPALVAGVVGTALGVPEQIGRPLHQTLIDAIQSRQLLLILDNCEHLVQACAQTSHTLLVGCPYLTVLATSRQPLRVDGEATWLVPSLGLPPASANSLSLGQSEAALLFLERARTMAPRFVLTEHNARWVAEVCRCLDGIPLALELAAARLAALGIEQLAHLLGESFTILTGGNRAALPRQQTLRGALDWSFRLLSEREQRLFERLGVFAGGWNLDAATAICTDAPLEAPDGLPDLLSRLVDQSLVIAQDPGGVTRYRLLEPVRQYALERLEATPDADRLRRRHATYFVRFAEAAEAQLLGREQLGWLEHLEREHDNMRACLKWATSTDRGDDLALRAATALVMLWHIRGYWSEGRRWLESSLSVSSSDDKRLRAKGLNAASWLAWDVGNYQQAGAYSEEALVLARNLDDDWSIGWSTGRLSHVRWMQVRYAEAAELAEEAIARFRDLNAPWYLGWALHQRGRIAHSAGDDELAERLFNESLAALQRAGDRGFATGFQFANLGDVAAARGDLQRAAGLYQQALLALRLLGFKQGLVHTLHSLADLWRKLGNRQRAIEDEREALGLCQDVGDMCGIAMSLEGLGTSAIDPDRAIQLLGAAHRLRLAEDCPATERQVAAAKQIAWLRAPISRDAFEQAWTRGATMTTAEAVALALEERDLSAPTTARSDPVRAEE
jgi:predicted ATPase/DNA-binding XRE family transcriptional regulator